MINRLQSQVKLHMEETHSLRQELAAAKQSAGSSSATQQQIDRLRRELEKTQSENGELREKVADSEEEIEKLQSDLEFQKQQVEALEHGPKEEIDLLQQKVADLTEENRKAEEELKEAQGAAGEQERLQRELDAALAQVETV